MALGKKGITISFLTYNGKVLQSDGKIVTEKRIMPPNIIGCRLYVRGVEKSAVAALDFDDTTVKAAGYNYNESEESGLKDYVLTYYLKDKGEYKTNDEINKKVKVYTCGGNVKLFKFLLDVYDAQYSNGKSEMIYFYSAGFIAQLLGYLTTKFDDDSRVHNFVLRKEKDGLGCAFDVDTERVGLHCELSSNINDITVDVSPTRGVPRSGLVRLTVTKALLIRKEDRERVIKKLGACIFATPSFVFSLSMRLFKDTGDNTCVADVKGIRFKGTNEGYRSVITAGDTRIRIDVGLSR